MTIQRSTPAASDRTRSTALASGELAGHEAHIRLARLMPFHRWCATLNPTEAAKELYLYVRARLKMRVTESLSTEATAARVRVKRPRASKSRTAAPIDGRPAEQRLG